MCCPLNCPACRNGIVPGGILDHEPEAGILEGWTQLLAACTNCNEVFRAKAIATHRGEVMYFTEVEGLPLLRAPCLGIPPRYFRHPGCYPSTGPALQDWRCPVWHVVPRPGGRSGG